jgi:hypothetical protein
LNTDTLTIPRRAFTSLVSQLVNGYPNPEDPEPSPWGPVIRRVLDRIRLVAGPHPEPWAWTALNPQPLPPRLAVVVALTQEVVEKLSSLHQLVDVLSGEAQAQAAQMADLYLSQFIDDCGNGRIPPWKRWPFPWPPRRDEMSEALNPAELVVIGAQLSSAVTTVAGDRLRRDLDAAGSKLIAVGLDRMG